MCKGYKHYKEFFMQIGDYLPSIPFKATSGLISNLDQYRGQWLVLYFYPKDATPGCTTEGCDFRDLDKEFSFLKATIFGISRDTLTSHEKFKKQNQYPFELISDPDETLCQLFDVMRTKSMYGKQVRGIERSTFLINPDGVVQHIWRKVKVEGHVNEVLQVIKKFENEPI